MEYFGNRYNLVLGYGSLRKIQMDVINPKNGKPYSYPYIRKVLQGDRKNLLITEFAENNFKTVEELS